jgi:hypothetical protein
LKTPTKPNNPDTQSAEYIPHVSWKLFVTITSLPILGIAAILYYEALDKSIPVVLPVFVFGTMGGLLSIQRRLKSMPRGELDLYTKSLSCTLLSPIVGGVLAIILYIVFIAEIIVGPLFPVFDTLNPAVYTTFSALFDVKASQPVQINYAKLLIWSLSAGLCENLVLNMVGKLKNDV